MVWVWPLGVGRYAEIGKRIEVPRQRCPTCELLLVWWGWYRRMARWLVGPGELVEDLLWIRRGRCQGCKIVHALLPDFLHEWRRDVVETIGHAVAEVVEDGRAGVHVAVRMGLPLSTVRNWRARHRQRAGALFAGHGRLAVELGADLAHVPANGERAALAAARESWEQARRRWGEELVGGLWRWWGRAAGGRPLGRRPPTFLGSSRSP